MSAPPPFWFRHGLPALAALALGFAFGYRQVGVTQREASARPPAPVLPSAVPTSRTTSAAPGYKAEEIYLLPFDVITAARWRQWLRSAPLDELESAISAACAVSMDWMAPSLEVWAERDGKASRAWMLAHADGGAKALGAWVTGMTRAAPQEARAWFDQFADADCNAMEAGMADIRRLLLQTWAGIDPNAAYNAWVKWENPQPPGGPREAGQLVPPEIYAGLGSLSDAEVLAFLEKHPETAESPNGLGEFFSTNPGHWMALASSPHAPSTLKNAANQYGGSNPRWTMEHLDNLDPEARVPMIANVLGKAHDLFPVGIKSTLAGVPLTSWLDQLGKEERASVIGGVAGAELLQDSSKALALMQGNNRSSQAKDFYESAAMFGGIEPRFMETQILNAEGSPEEVARLRLAFAAGTEGAFSSPHDAICRAISFQDPGLRHTAIALVLLNQTDPEVRQTTYQWLDGLPPGTVEKAQMEYSLKEVQSHPDRWAAIEIKKPPADDQFAAVAALVKSMP